MSSGTNPIPSPSPAPAPAPAPPPSNNQTPASGPVDWNRVLITVFAAMATWFAGLHWGSGSTPSVTPSGNTPAGNVPAGNVPANTNGGSTPSVIPPAGNTPPSGNTPTGGTTPGGGNCPPNSVPPAPVANLSTLTIVDEQGSSILSAGSTTCSIDGGKLLVAKAASGVDLTPIASNPADAGITQFSDNQIAATLRNQCKLQLIITGNNQKPAIVSVTCNPPPQPPPPAPVTPVVPVNPAPVNPAPVSTGPLRIAVIENPLTRTNLTAAVLNDVGFWNGLQAKGHSVRVYAPSTTEVAGLQAVNAGKAAGLITAAGVAANPVLVVFNQQGQVLTSIALPMSIPTIQSTITSLGG